MLLYEIAEYLDITEDFLTEAVQHYYQKYGFIWIDNDHILSFEPLGILDIYDFLNVNHPAD